MLVPVLLKALAGGETATGGLGFDAAGLDAAGFDFRAVDFVFASLAFLFLRTAALLLSF